MQNQSTMKRAIAALALAVTLAAGWFAGSVMASGNTSHAVRTVVTSRSCGNPHTRSGYPLIPNSTSLRLYVAQAHRYDWFVCASGVWVNTP